MKQAIRLFFAAAALVCLSSCPADCQEQLGLRAERRAGIWSAAANPAHVAFFPKKWDLSLASLDFFGENSYAFFRETSLPHLLRNSDKVVSVATLGPDDQPRAGDIVQDFYRNRSRMHAVGQARLAGPSFSLRLGDRHTLGLTTALRGAGGAYRVPQPLSYQYLDPIPYGTNVPVVSVRAAGMAWGEIGLLYALRDEESTDYVLAFGAAPKLLLGFEGGFVDAESEFVFRQLNPDSLAFDSGNWRYGITTETAEMAQNGQDFSPKINGKGWGLDLGFSIAMPADDGEDDYDYLWRVGASLLDVGSLRFTSGGAQEHLIRFSDTVQIGTGDFKNFSTPTDLLEKVSREFLGNKSASLQANEFSIATPAAISLQGSYRAMPFVYVHAMLTQRLPLLKNAIKRPNTLAIVPAFEHPWGAFSLPLVLDDWSRFRPGAAMRLGPLVLGSDNLLALLKRERLTGADYYIGLKINAFSLKFLERFGGLGASGRHWDFGGGDGCFR